MHRERNLLPRIIDFANLYRAFIAASAGKRHDPQVQARVLDVQLAAGQVEHDTVRASLASWFGLARHANADRLSRAVFAARDVNNLGKLLLLRQAKGRIPSFGLR